jgi:hypothetical protein
MRIVAAFSWISYDTEASKAVIFIVPTPRGAAVDQLVQRVGLRLDRFDVARRADHPRGSRRIRYPVHLVVECGPQPREGGVVDALAAAHDDVRAGERGDHPPQLRLLPQLLEIDAECRGDDLVEWALELEWPAGIDDRTGWAGDGLRRLTGHRHQLHADQPAEVGAGSRRIRREGRLVGDDVADGVRSRRAELLTTPAHECAHQRGWERPRSRPISNAAARPTSSRPSGVSVRSWSLTWTSGLSAGSRSVGSGPSGPRYQAVAGSPRRDVWGSAM